MKKSSKFLIFVVIILLFQTNSFAKFESYFSALDREPLVRIGLETDATSVSITTSDTSLVLVNDKTSSLSLGTTSVRISSQNYNPPRYEIYRFEIPNLTSNEAANQLAQQIIQENFEKAVIMNGDAPNTWKIRIGNDKTILADAKDYQKILTEKGILGVEIVTEKYTLPSDDAIALTQQIAMNPKFEVRSLFEPNVTNQNLPLVQKTALSKPVRNNKNAFVNPSLREVIVSGNSEAARFSTLKPVVIGSFSQRGAPVKLNGKSYRGMMEISVNSRGRLTVVNVVPMEDYLLGVVPSELSLPQLEAQKAQAVAARTYAVANQNGYKDKGFDMVDTVWSQVYKGVSIESKMGTQAVLQTRGLIATYKGTPITAYYTSTCGGRTEDSENIFDHAEPYLRGVNCSLEGNAHFLPFLVKSTRDLADIKNEANYELVIMAAKYSVNNFLFVTPRFTDQYFEDAPNETELKSWLNQLAVKFGKPFPLVITKDTAKPLLLAKVLSDLIYDDPLQADTLLSEADINYQLSFLDGGEVPKEMRPILASLMRDGWFSIYSDLTLKPQKHFSRAKILRLIDHIYSKKNWNLSFESGEAKPTEDGKLVLRIGRSEKEINVNPNVYLFRKFGDEFYQVKEAALLGGEKVNYKTDASGSVIYLEIEPTDKTTVAERDSSFTLWNKTLSPAAVRSTLSRFVNGLGEVTDLNIVKKGFSRRATDIEIITTNGTFHLKGGKIRSGLRLNEQLFVINKRYDSAGRVTSYTFTGRGWGHGVGMCQYGAYGLAKMGVKYDAIIKHYYTGVDLTKAY
jgi:stage II sporulation protein D